MALRRSSIALFVVGLMLTAAAAAIKYVAVPNLSKLPADTNETALFESTLRQLDPTTFGLDSGTPITIDRSLRVVQAEGDSAILTSTAITHLPSGDATDVHTFAVSRVDFTQTTAPDGVPVEDQRGGMTMSFPKNPTTDDALVYDSVTRTAQPVTYTGTTMFAGREVHEFTGTTAAPIADPAVLGPLKAGIAVLDPSGVGSKPPPTRYPSPTPRRTGWISPSIPTSAHPSISPRTRPPCSTSRRETRQFRFSISTRFGWKPPMRRSGWWPRRSHGRNGC